MPKSSNVLSLKVFFSCFVALFFLGISALAEPTKEEISLGDKKLILTDTGEGEQFITLDGEELLRNFFVGVETTTTIYETPVIVLSSSDGGNACGPDLLIVWIDDEGKAEKLPFDSNCDTPSVATASSNLFFVPYVGPGDSKPLKSWSPEAGLVTAGIVEFTSEAGTNWSNLVEQTLTHPLDFFSNEAIYKQIMQLLGNDLALYALALGTASEPEFRGGIYVASGCVPHNCGGQDALIVVDPQNKLVFMAQQNQPDFNYWPARATWNEPALKALEIFEKDHKK